jgi:glycosyltransferase involved in cell wall biosynthesis
LPYLRAVAGDGVRVHLLTYEKRASWRKGERRRRGVLKQALAADGICWHWLKYHRRPSLAATACDILLGILYGAWLVIRHRVNVIHARAHVAGVIGLALKRVLNLKLIFDLRGLMAEEYVDNGIWAEGSLPFRLVKRCERALIRQADRLVVLTEALKAALLNAADLAVDAKKIYVIPCCADLSRYDQAARLAKKTDSFTLVYVGSLSGRYLLGEMMGFFKAIQRHRAGARFLVLTRGDHTEVRRQFAASGIDPTGYSIVNAEPGEVPALICAADIAISFYRQSAALLGTSPTKIGEYLAAGLPVVSTPGGDTDAILQGEEVGVIVGGLTARDYEPAAVRLLALVERGDAAGLCRAVARKIFSLAEVGGPRYVALYHSLHDERPASAEAVSVAYER